MRLRVNIVCNIRRHININMCTHIINTVALIITSSVAMVIISMADHVWSEWCIGELPIRLQVFASATSAITRRSRRVSCSCGQQQAVGLPA